MLRISFWTMCLIGCGLGGLGAPLAAEDVAADDSPAERAVGNGPAASPERMLASAEAIRLFEQRVAANPRDYLSGTVLGRLYLRQARDEHDEGAYARAEDVLRKAITVNPNYASARAYLASTLNSQHKFIDALDEAERCLEDRPDSTLALAALGDAQLELGRYADARQTYQRLVDLSPSPPVWARQARLAELNGRTAEVTALLIKALDEARAQADSPADTVWYQFRLGDFFFRTGEVSQADAFLTAALDARGDHHPSLIALSRVRSAQDRHDEAAALLEQVVEATPHFDLLAELGDVYALAGRDDLAKEKLQQAESIAATISDDPLEARHLALFYADHGLQPALAVRIAREDLQRRQDIYAWDTLAWALCQNNELDEALDAIGKARQLGTQDPQLFYHAAMIHHRRGETDDARECLQHLNRLNPAFSAVHRETIREIFDKLDISNGN